MSELLPCPFCGGEAEPFNPFENIDGTWCVLCSGCACSTGFEQTEAEAIVAWNTRAERTCRSTTNKAAWCFVCSECGKSFPRNKLHLAHNHGDFNYCPNCGRKVVCE